jgi:hypothetical protein
MELEQYAEVLKRGDISEISSWSLNKVFIHYDKIDGKTFGLITTSDASQFSDIQEELENLGIGFFKLKCIWENDRNIPWFAMSLFALNIQEKDAEMLYKKYDKCSVLYEETDGSYKKERLYGQVRKHKGDDFTFLGFQWIPMGMMTNMALEAHLKE